MEMMPDIGTVVNHRGLLNDPKYRQLIAENFTVIYPENGFKLATVKNQHSYDFSEADLAVQFATDHGLKVRGHTLLWHFSIPEWLSTRCSVDENRKQVKDYFHTILTRYPSVRDWDVCNECFDDRGYPRRHLSFLLGTDYISWAFQTAYNIRPDARLFYCDNQVKSAQKWKSVSDRLAMQRESGVPIHGVALQAHSNLATLRPQRLSWEISKLRDLGFEVQVPEMVVWNSRSIPAGQFVQLNTYKSLVMACFEAGASLVGFWSPFDVYPWTLTSDQCQPGLWDINHHPKATVSWLREKLGKRGCHFNQA